MACSPYSCDACGKSVPSCLIRTVVVGGHDCCACAECRGDDEDACECGENTTKTGAPAGIVFHTEEDLSRNGPRAHARPRTFGQASTST